ncbi:MucBP domain-containing protein [Erysipelothrix aquatica]|uniref:MucBP domain-containing protein n=1 Tax=Erysipelothrix aquatica TaxID=2683714 RepID=UPI001359BE47|nr:MucBP domain-containing protein [Erysipelothrix aquatica]
MRKKKHKFFSFIVLSLFMSLMTAQPIRAEEAQPVSELFPNPSLAQYVTDHPQLNIVDGKVTQASLDTVEFIDLRSNVTITSLQELAPFRNVTEIHLREQAITTLEGLSNFPQLTGLLVNFSSLQTLSGIEAAPNLIGLYISESNLESLDGLQHIKGLRALTIFNPSHKIVEQGTQMLEPIRNLPITDLRLQNIGVTDAMMDPITSLKELRTIHLNSSFSKDKDDSRDHVTKTTDVLANKITSLSPLTTLSLLADIQLNNNRLTSYEGIESFTNLQTFTVNTDLEYSPLLNHAVDFNRFIFAEYPTATKGITGTIRDSIVNSSYTLEYDAQAETYSVSLSNITPPRTINETSGKVYEGTMRPMIGKDDFPMIAFNGKFDKEANRITWQAFDLEGKIDATHVEIFSFGIFDMDPFEGETVGRTRRFEVIGYGRVEARDAADVTVNYMDTKGNTLEVSEVLSGLGKLNQDYVTQALEFANFNLVRVDGPRQGTFTTESKVVNFIYERKDAAPVILNHTDETGNELAPSQLLEGTQQLGNPYTTQAQVIENYTLSVRPENAVGVFMDALQVVNYIYTRRDAKDVIVHYVDVNGNSLTDDIVLSGTGKLGVSYQTESKHFPYYTLREVPLNQKGIFGVDDQVVTYVYAKQQSTLTVYHVDQDGNPLTGPQVITADVGTAYQTNPKVFLGYDLIAMPANANGLLLETPQTITYRYLGAEVLGVTKPPKGKEPLKPTAPNVSNPVEKETLPATGMAQSTVGYWVLGFGLLSVMIAKTKHQEA